MLAEGSPENRGGENSEDKAKSAHFVLWGIQRLLNAKQSQAWKLPRRRLFLHFQTHCWSGPFLLAADLCGHCQYRLAICALPKFVPGVSAWDFLVATIPNPYGLSQ